jgi:SAM-dependent methyltransferase
MSLGSQYDSFATRYAATIEQHPYRLYYEKPATLALIPDVSGKSVLDAGCGPGIYSEWLLQHGAQVVACDYAETFVEITRQRTNDAAQVLQADLNQPLTFAADESFDLILSALTLHYIEDWRALFAEFYRVLRHNGAVVFSVNHPIYDLETRKTYNYFDTELCEMLWKNFGEPYPRVSIYRRPLCAMLNPIIEAGFRLDILSEPKPLPEFEQTSPEDYARWTREPSLLCVRAIKA